MQNKALHKISEAATDMAAWKLNKDLKMNKPLVSVIIPTYNNPQLLQQAVVSLLRNQATKNLMEIIVVNNGHKNSCDFLAGQKQVRVISTREGVIHTTDFIKGRSSHQYAKPYKESGFKDMIGEISKDIL